MDLGLYYEVGYFFSVHFLNICRLKLCLCISDAVSVLEMDNSRYCALLCHIWCVWYLSPALSSGSASWVSSRLSSFFFLSSFLSPAFLKKSGGTWFLAFRHSVRLSVRPSVLPSPYRSMYLVWATPPTVLFRFF